MLCNWSTLRVWLLVMILAASLGGTSAFAQGSTVLRVDPSTSSIQVNDTVNLAIKVDSVANLAAFELHLSFDPNVVEVTSLTNGGFVAADVSAQNTFDNNAGTIDYAIAQLNRSPAQGSGTLLTISFRGKAPGSSQVTTRATPAAPDGFILSDQNGMSIPSSWLPGNINLGTPPPTTVVPPTTAVPTTAIPTTPGPTTPAPTTPVSTTSVPTTPVSTTPAPITPPPTVTPAPGTLGIHIVRWGEWLYCIGRAYKVSPWAIAKTNGIWWPYIIFPNQKLTIPNVPWTNISAGRVCTPQFNVTAPTTPVPTTPVPTTAVPTTPVPTTPAPTTPAPTTPAPVTTVPPSSCRATYVVRRGDTLYNIALRYGTSYAEIARVNQISNPRLIFPGQQLCIP